MITLDNISFDIADAVFGGVGVSLRARIDTEDEANLFLSEVKKLAESVSHTGYNAVSIKGPCGLCEEIQRQRNNDNKLFEEARQKFEAIAGKIKSEQQQLERSNINLRNELREARATSSNSEEHWAIKHSERLADQLKKSQSENEALVKELRSVTAALLKAEGSKPLDPIADDPSGRFGLLEID